jgi:soluble lytic murein transglycosylase-like protein
MAALCLAAGLLMDNAVPVQAEPYLRVRKNGVIYYYFANKESNSPERTFRTYRRIRVNPAPAQRRLTPQELEPLIQEACRPHNLPPSLVKAVIRVESNFNPAATSPKGAQGLMQLMPGTADDLMVADPYDPGENVRGGVRYLSMLLEKFNYRLPLALAAYNAGPQRVSQRQEVPAIPETQGFVHDVCNEFLKYSKE